MSINEMVVQEAEKELKNMLTSLKQALIQVKTVEEALLLQEEIEDVQAALEDVIIHKDHFVQYGFIYQ